MQTFVLRFYFCVCVYVCLCFDFTFACAFVVTFANANTVDSYNCACQSGVAGNGATCTDVDECATIVNATQVTQATEQTPALTWTSAQATRTTVTLRHKHGWHLRLCMSVGCCR